MAGKSYGAGAIFERGEIWDVSFWADARQIQKSSWSRKRQDAVRLRDHLLGKKARGEMGLAAADKVTCGELLDDLLEHAKHNTKASTEKIWKLVVEASLRPFFGHRRAASLNTAVLKEYHRKRLREGQPDGCSSAAFHRDGVPIKAFRFTWRKACAAAGVPDLQFHDLRRTAVRNAPIRRSPGCPQRISGHRTDSTERRYNIVDIEDIQSAKELMQKRRRENAAEDDHKD